MLGWEEPEVCDRAFKKDRVVVTCNVADVLEHARGCEPHAGLTLIERSGLTRPQLLAVMRAAVTFIESHDMANRVLWVTLDGTMEFEDIPPG